MVDHKRAMLVNHGLVTMWLTCRK